MKRSQILQTFCVCAGMAGLQAQGQQTLNTGQYASSPYYADFTETHLTVDYTYTSGTGIGEFVITCSSSLGMSYESGSSSLGTHGDYTEANSPFTGTYTMDAYIEKISGTWQVISNSSDPSTVTIQGNLPDVSGFSSGISGVTVGTTSDVLLQGSLRTGVNTFGFTTTGSSLEFLYNVTGGNSTILEDFFGAGVGAGGIIVEPGTYNTIPTGFSDTFTQNFSNKGSGTADTFVPEPAVYPVAAGVVAFFGLAIVNRKQPRTYALAAAPK